MSAFRRFSESGKMSGSAARNQLPGTKPWLNGQSIISTGNIDLNNVCGSGIPLGSIVLLAEDFFICQAIQFTKLFVAEGIHSKQNIWILTDEHESDWIQSIPSQKEIQKQPDTSSEKKTWQYNQYRPGRNQETIQFCHSFDLSKQEVDHDRLSRIQSSLITKDFSVRDILSRIATFIQQCNKEGVVGRIIFVVPLYILADVCINERGYK